MASANAGREARDEDRGDADLNQVRLVGRVSGDPEEVVLPSGDTWWAFRTVVRRPSPTAAERRAAREAGRREATVDALECVVRCGRARRTAATLATGDRVEVAGELRRRFYRVGGAAQSRVEVVVATVRVTRRAGRA